MTTEHRACALAVHSESVPRTGGISTALWITLRGDADRTNVHQLQTALCGIELGDHGEVHLQLAELTFCDIEAFRRLATFAQNTMDKGHPVFAHGASSVIRKMITLFDIQDALKLP
jgi:ABC-type transporter Mla MlaB component